jgi:hypothetical protein
MECFVLLTLHPFCKMLFRPLAVCQYLLLTHPLCLIFNPPNSGGRVAHMTPRDLEQVELHIGLK